MKNCAEDSNGQCTGWNQILTTQIVTDYKGRKTLAIGGTTQHNADTESGEKKFEAEFSMGYPKKSSKSGRTETVFISATQD